MPVPRTHLALAGPLACAAAGLLSAPGAAAQAASRGSVEVDTIAGVVHVANHGGGAWTPATAWRAREVLRLGGPTAPVEQAFLSQLLGTSLGPDGRVYVLDFVGRTIHVFSPGGRPIRTLGGPGQGPSELSAPVASGWSREGELWVADWEGLKYVVFDTAGGLVRTFRRPWGPVARRQFPLMDVDGVGIVDQATEDGTLVLLRVAPDGGRRDTLGVVPFEGGPSRAVSDAFTVHRSPELERVVRDYVPRMRWAIDPSGGIWTASTDELRFIKRDWDGDTLMVVTADHRASRLTGEDERLISRALGPARLDRSDLRAARPVLERLTVIDGGYLLVQTVETPGEASSRFDVYDPGGRYLGELDVGFPVDGVGTFGGRGDVLLGTALGAMDVPLVVGVELIRPRD